MQHDFIKCLLSENVLRLKITQRSVSVHCGGTEYMFSNDTQTRTYMDGHTVYLCATLLSIYVLLQMHDALVSVKTAKK